MLPQQWMQWIWPAAAVAALMLGGYLLMKLFRFEVKHIIERTVKGKVLDPALLKWIDEISGVMRLAVMAVVTILAAFFILRAMGHPAVAGWDFSIIVNWLMAHGLRIVLLLAGAYLASKITNLLVSNIGLLIRPFDESKAAEMERQKRAKTISGILQKFATTAIVGVAVLMLLMELNVNITPILTSVGVIGVALGFGAQQMVGDFISGFFIIFENQMRIGDVAIINGTGGLVEEIHLRTTVLRSLDGTVHVFRNGTINTLSNMTRSFSYYVVDLGVAYKEDTDRVCQVVREVVAGMQAEEKYGHSILEPVDILGVDEFADSAVNIKLRIKTLPIKQWEVGREFRRRIKYRFDKEGIEIPFPHRSIYFGEVSKPFNVNVSNSGEQQPPSTPPGATPQPNG